MNLKITTEKTLTIIMGGGAGTRLFPLTKERAKPAVPLGGKYRLVDIPISNCLHADIRRIFVLTQFNSTSLNRHISQTYRMDPFSQGSVRASTKRGTAPIGTELLAIPFITSQRISLGVRGSSRNAINTTASALPPGSAPWSRFSVCRCGSRPSLPRPWARRRRRVF